MKEKDYVTIPAQVNIYFYISRHIPIAKLEYFVTIPAQVNTYFYLMDLLYIKVVLNCDNPCTGQHLFLQMFTSMNNAGDSMVTIP